MHGGIAGQSVLWFGTARSIAVDSGCCGAVADFQEDGFLLLAGSGKDKAAVGVGDDAVFADIAFRPDAQLQRVGVGVAFVAEGIAVALAGALHLVAYHLIAAQVAHHLFQLAQRGERPTFWQCLASGSIGVVDIVVADHHRHVVRLAVLLGTGPVGCLVAVEDGYVALALEVFCHPEQAARLDNGVAVARLVDTGIEVEGNAVASFRSIYDDGRHLSAGGFKAQDVAFVEVHPHHIG